MSTSNPIQADAFREAVANSAALRCRISLLPAGGESDKVFPPTYLGGAYATETRRREGGTTESVVLDSVQSQANRFEEALQTAVDDGLISIPVLSVDVPSHGRVTSLQAPHRIADAIFRDSLLEGKPFHRSPAGQRFLAATVANATAVYEWCPTALVFGYWNSHAGLGTRAAKIARALCSEIVGFAAIYGERTGGRLDPLGIPKQAATIYKHKNAEEMWTLEESDAFLDKGKPVLFKTGVPSEIGHGNVPPDFARHEKDRDKGEKVRLKGGATISHAEQTVVLSLPQLRRLRFPDDKGKSTPERDTAGRAVLAALGLVAVALQHRQGYDLRSRCVLVPQGQLRFELLGTDVGEDGANSFSLPVTETVELLKASVTHAEKHGLTWKAGIIPLQPSPKLVKLVEQARNVTDASAD